MSSVPVPLPFDASPQTRQLLSSLGRTEDIKFAPGGRFLALAEIVARRILLLPVEIAATHGAYRIRVGSPSVISSPDLRMPHGIHFLDDAHMVVANRRGNVTVFDVSQAVAQPGEYRLSPVAVLGPRVGGRVRARTPGSVAAYADEQDPGCRQLLVCNNDWHTVSSHRVRMGKEVRFERHGIRIENGLRIPDGVDVSPDRRWVAVSNHARGQLLIYENDAGLDRHRPPTHVVAGLVCPHGVRFMSSGRRLLVADAASPYIYIIERSGERWEGPGVSMRAARMQDDAGFWRSRSNAREGGIKGIDVDGAQRVLVTTHRDQVLAFYELEQVLAQAAAPDESLLSQLAPLRDRSLQRQKAQALEQRWRTGSLVHSSALRLGRRIRNRAQRLGVRLELRRRRVRNRWSRQSILDPSGPIVSLATYGARTATAYAAIESIGRGDVKPARIILWLGTGEARPLLPDSLTRLAERGLEIRHAENLGSHTKYFPYLAGEERFVAPLVTADDDALYSRTWLRELMAAYERNPRAVHAFRVHRMALANGRLLSYPEWAPATSSRPSHLHFATGVSGILYPPELLARIQAAGRGFLSSCPLHDDVWLKVQALRSGYPVAQVRARPVRYRSIPGTPPQEQLSTFNLKDGGAHAQILSTFSESDLALLREADAAERKPQGARD